MLVSAEDLQSHRAVLAWGQATTCGWFGSGLVHIRQRDPSIDQCLPVLSSDVGDLEMNYRLMRGGIEGGEVLSAILIRQKVS